MSGIGNLRPPGVDPNEPLDLRHRGGQLSEVELPLASSPWSSDCRPMRPLAICPRGSWSFGFERPLPKNFRWRFRPEGDIQVSPKRSLAVLLDHLGRLHQNRVG